MRMSDLVLPVIRIGVLTYGGLCLLLFLRQSRYVYYPDRSVDFTPADVGLEWEDLRIPTEDGETLSAWFVPSGEEAAEAHSPVILLCHGNAGDIGDRVSLLRTFHDMGMAVLIFDYRGYGGSSGRPSEAGTHHDAMAAWRYLVDSRGIPPRQIVLLGRSLGGAIATGLAAEITPAALIVESTFTSALDMARRMFPYLPLRWICRFRYDTLNALKRVHCPVLVAHGPHDEMIPFEHGRRVFEAAPEPKCFVELTGGHNEGGPDVDEAYRQELLRFLGEACGFSSLPAPVANVSTHPEFPSPPGGEGQGEGK